MRMLRGVLFRLLRLLLIVILIVFLRIVNFVSCVVVVVVTTLFLIAFECRRFVVFRCIISSFAHLVSP